MPQVCWGEDCDGVKQSDSVFHAVTKLVVMAMFITHKQLHTQMHPRPPMIARTVTSGVRPGSRPCFELYILQ